MRRVLCLLAFLTLASPLWGDFVIKGDVSVKRDHIVRLTASGHPAGSAIIWDISNEDAADPEESGCRYLFTGAPGVYKIKARAVSVDKTTGQVSIQTAKTTVTIADPAPPAPVPPPTPPVPPTPPGPVPDATLVAALQPLYTADASPSKADYKAKLQALYAQAGSLLDQPSVKTAGDLLTALVTARKALLPDNALVSVRARLQSELGVIGVAPTAPLTDDVKATARAVFTKISLALEVVK